MVCFASIQSKIWHRFDPVLCVIHSLDPCWLIGYRIKCRCISRKICKMQMCKIHKICKIFRLWKYEKCKNAKQSLPNQPQQTISTKLNQYTVNAWVSSAFGNVVTQRFRRWKKESKGKLDYEDDGDCSRKVVIYRMVDGWIWKHLIETEIQRDE